VYTPKDFDLTRIVRDIVELVDASAGRSDIGDGASANGSA
jgi:hypothetical protein